MQVNTRVGVSLLQNVPCSQSDATTHDPEGGLYGKGLKPARNQHIMSFGRLRVLQKWHYSQHPVVRWRNYEARVRSAHVAMWI